MQLVNYLKGWEPFRTQWTMEKRTFIDSFDKTEPGPETFHENISKYAEIANQISVQETTLGVRYIYLHAGGLKNSVIQHIDKWQNLHMELLSKRSMAKIDHIYDYINEMTLKIAVQPTDSTSMRQALYLHDEIYGHTTLMKSKFKEIRTHFRTMGKIDQ